MADGKVAPTEPVFTLFIGTPLNENDKWPENALLYYLGFQQDHELQVEKGFVLGQKAGRADMLEFLKKIVELQSRRILLVTHATPMGPHFRIGGSGDPKAEPLKPLWYKMIMMMHLISVWQEYDRISKTAARHEVRAWFPLHARVHADGEYRFTSMQAAIKSLLVPAESKKGDEFQKQVEKFSAEKSRALQANSPAKTEAGSKRLDDIAKKFEQGLQDFVGAVQADVEIWMTNVVKALELGNHFSDAAAFVQALLAVHKVGVEAVQIRGCNLGLFTPAMTVLCLFLGAKKLLAPNGPNFYSLISPDVITDPSAFGKSVRSEQGKIAGQRKKFSKCPRGPKKCEDLGSKISDVFPLQPLPNVPDEVQFFFFEPPKLKNTPREATRNRLVAEHEEALMAFVVANLGAPRNGLKVGNKLPLPLQWLGTAKAVFPRQKKFGTFLVQVNPGRFNLTSGKLEK